MVSAKSVYRSDQSMFFTHWLKPFQHVFVDYAAENKNLSKVKHCKKAKISITTF